MQQLKWFSLLFVNCFIASIRRIYLWNLFESLRLERTKYAIKFIGYLTHNTEIRHKPFTKIKVFKQTFVFNFDIDTFAYEWSLKNLNEPLTRIEILWLHKTFSIEIFFTFFLLHIKCLIFPIKTPELELEMKKVFLSNFSSIFWNLQGMKKVWLGIDSVAFESVAGTQNFNTIHSNALKLDLFKDWIINTNTYIKQRNRDWL